MKRNFTKILLTSVMFMTSAIGAKAEVDPNFHIYICFGQSNMEGNAQWEKQDEGNVDPRFQMLATCDFTTPKRKKGNWYTAECPIVSPVGKLGPTDYFGRTMVANLPENHKVGVIAVAMGGSPIEMFDKDLYEQKYKDNYNEWWAQIARNYYGENPYGRIIEMAKKAQEVGVIKGILLHQGESNNGDEKWPGMVKKIYKDMLHDLGLKASDVHIFVGETEYENMGGGCSWHNHVVAKIPEVIPTGHVVSAEGIPGNGSDPWHFSAAGYRTFGKRYAEAVLDVMNHPEKYVKYYTVDERLSGTTKDIANKDFAIVNESEQKAFYCESGNTLSYGDYVSAFDISNECYFFRLQKSSGGFRMRLVTPDGNYYQVDGADSYLNTQVVDGDCCFVGGLNNQNGQDLAKGAVWSMEYVDGKGWTIKNVGTGKYLKDATSPAKYDEPTYFTFCSLKETDVPPTGIEEVRYKKSEVRKGVYTLDGRQVNTDNLRPGLYIRNGKKVVIK
jgi:lysophospholipase L1-like esterase